MIPTPSVEEVLELHRAGIEFDVVPGITAATGVSSYAGIPLTHRGLSQGVHFVTGQLQNGDASAINWRCLASPDTTLVIYMGLASLAHICAELVAAGLPSGTPAAAIHQGTREQQQKVVADLAQLPAEVARAGLKSPVTTIIGEVVQLNEELDWFDRQRQAADESFEHESFGLARA